MIDLGTLGGGSSNGNDVNNAGVVIGTSQFGESKDTHGFIWTKATGIENLNNLIPSDSGWTITKASGINDKGQIAVLGFKTGVGSRALLLTPIKR
jgi:probable HAF family extracellular repeat protein